MNSHIMIPPPARYGNNLLKCVCFLMITAYPLSFKILDKPMIVQGYIGASIHNDKNNHNIILKNVIA